MNVEAKKIVGILNMSGIIIKNDNIAYIILTTVTPFISAMESVISMDALMIILIIGVKPAVKIKLKLIIK